MHRPGGFAPEANGEKVLLARLRRRCNSVSSGLDPFLQEDGVVRILLVEDDPLQARIASEILAAGGHRVRIAEGARSAREAAGGQLFDLAIVDVILEDGDGFELVAELQEGHPELPCVLMTGNDVPRGRERAESLGARFYTKPVDYTEIVSGTG